MEYFKRSTKSIFKPPKYKHFSRGSNLGNILLTRINVEELQGAVEDIVGVSN